MRAFIIASLILFSACGSFDELELKRANELCESEGGVYQLDFSFVADSHGVVHCKNNNKSFKVRIR